MAFEFPSRLNDQIFFPTVHIHDGEVHEIEEFDHTLYLQHESFDGTVDVYVNDDVVDNATGMVRSKVQAGKFCNTELTRGIVQPNLLLHRREIRGRHTNQDTCQNVSLSLGPFYGLRRRAFQWWPLAVIGASCAGLGWLFSRRSKLKAERLQNQSGP